MWASLLVRGSLRRMPSDLGAIRRRSLESNPQMALFHRKETQVM